MIFKTLLRSFVSLVLTAIIISLVNAELIQQIQDKSVLNGVKTNPTGSVVFFNHSTEKPGLSLINLFLVHFYYQVLRLQMWIFKLPWTAVQLYM